MFRIRDLTRSKKKPMLTPVSTPTVLAVYCSDPRFQHAFERFLRKELKLARGKFVPIVIAGGPGSLANPAMVEEISVLKRQILFFLKHNPSVRSIVLINHEDCGFYRNVIPNHICKKNREREDAPVTAKVVIEHLNSNGFLDIEVTAYYASFANAKRNRINIERV